MTAGEVPMVWKEALVTAIPKKSNANLLSSYHPISIVPSASKVLEKIVKDKLCAWLSHNSVIPEEQPGFILGSSTTTLLSDSFYDWMVELNKGKSEDVVFFDISKAFDMVSHQKLILKLENYGIRGQLLSSLKSYLSERHMTVKVQNCFSEHCALQRGVPQGELHSQGVMMVRPPIYVLDVLQFGSSSGP
ncbi:hypothetical protein Y032_0010g885 [Ancylostoma ceylanicum]|uniref:Reverse transcriptase domain-containing protein n=1 Tax=Ancylostoma ceylanicum TaxID=53326 RepID=A0A016VIR9_9BILA|nr:hypothetical protein Y032_0010g885 [Ancylostoma ceylanicum]